MVSGDSLSNDDTTEGSERDNRSASLFPYTDTFCKQFPYYLSIGMTAEQYWSEDNTLVIYYREADKIRRDRVNEEAWLQGMYVYDAVSRLTPVLHAFAKKGTKPKPYPEEPYPITKKKVEDKEVKKEKANETKGINYMYALMARNNKKYKKEGE